VLSARGMRASGRDRAGNGGFDRLRPHECPAIRSRRPAAGDATGPRITLWREHETRNERMIDA